jgi:hypothetical protein
MGGFKGKRAGAAIREKIKLLEKEGIEVRDGRIVNFEKVFFRLG